MWRQLVVESRDVRGHVEPLLQPHVVHAHLKIKTGPLCSEYIFFSKLAFVRSVLKNPAVLFCMLFAKFGKIKGFSVFRIVRIKWDPSEQQELPVCKTHVWHPKISLNVREHQKREPNLAPIFSSQKEGYLLCSSGLKCKACVRPKHLMLLRWPVTLLHAKVWHKLQIPSCSIDLISQFPEFKSLRGVRQHNYI